MDSSIKNYIKQLVQEAVNNSFSHQTNQTGRKPLVVANWKMNKNLQEALSFVQDIEVEEGAEVILCPPAPLLYPVAQASTLQAKSLHIGAQNVHQEASGAYTGEIAGSLLKDIGCKYTLIGHSERRQYFQEDDQTINQKVKRALEEGLIPIICIGETLADKQQSLTEKVLTTQLLGALDDISLTDVVLAYEPVWAIGTGESATAQDAQAMHSYIRAVLTHIDRKLQTMYPSCTASVNEKMRRNTLSSLTSTAFSSAAPA